MIDPDDLRDRSLAAWCDAAPGWEARQAQLRRANAPVSHWLVEAIDPQPGAVVLELAAGAGETGFLAAELVRPGGRLICSDGSDAMLDVARSRAAQLGLQNVEFEVIGAEWIDLALASVDAVLCSWGYMLLADPAAALRETRRVLRPGGYLALSVWDMPERNPWITALRRVLVARGYIDQPEPGAPGSFALGDPVRLRELLGEAGFGDVHIETVEFGYSYSGFDDWLDSHRALAPGLGDALDGLDDETAAMLRGSVAAFAEAEQGLLMPASTLVASAQA